MTVDPRIHVLVKQNNANATRCVQQALEQAGYRATLVPDEISSHACHVAASYEVLLVEPRPADAPQETTTHTANPVTARHALLAALQHTSTRLRMEVMQRQRAEAWLVECGRQLQLLVDTLPEGLCRLDQTGRIILANTTAAHLLRWEREGLLGQAWDTLVPDEEVTPAQAWPHAATRYAGETTLWRKDGTQIRVAYTSTPLYDRAAYRGRVVLFRDRPTSQQTPQAMQPAERFALVGRVALAHHMRMPLQLIAENAALLQLELQAQGMQIVDLDTIAEQAERLAQVLANFLTLQEATPDPLLLPVVLYEPLNQALRLVQSHVAYHAVTVTTAIPPDLPRVWGVADQMAQVFLNILLNALGAMPNGGTVAITAGVTDTQQVQVTFRDAGCGMAPATLARVFEPFFSTKHGQGTGLGLTICHQLMEQHGGAIHLDSTPEAGTTVMLAFQIVAP